MHSTDGLLNNEMIKSFSDVVLVKKKHLQLRPRRPMLAEMVVLVQLEQQHQETTHLIMVLHESRERDQQRMETSV
jgi:hypothetical protein